MVDKICGQCSANCATAPAARILKCNGARRKWVSSQAQQRKYNNVAARQTLVKRLLLTSCKAMFSVCVVVYVTCYTVIAASVQRRPYHVMHHDSCFAFFFNGIEKLDLWSKY